MLMKSNPKTKRIILTDNEIINATIWFLVRLEAKIPMLTSDEDNKIAPIYCATRAPTSKFPAKANEIGINIVPNIPIVININPARNFANITVVPLTG